MKGYKVFNPDWTCRGFKYEVGKTYESQDEIILCYNGFHFCENIALCFNYYSFNPMNKVAEIEAIGKIVTDGNKSATNIIKIVRELSWEEVLKLANTGINNTGFCNSGNWNSGNWNSGNRNSGNWNSGNWNSGHYNSGNWNSGNCNSGNRNSGNWNSGNCNSGNCNSGNWNSGHYNSGNWNSGNWNSGDWNISSYSNGCFNTKEQKIFMFNNQSDWTLRDWMNSEAHDLFNRVEINEWIQFEHMSEIEKKNHTDAERLNGYLRVNNRFDACKKWWGKLTNKEKSVIKALPNFDAKIFKWITGIDVEEDGEENA